MKATGARGAEVWRLTVTSEGGEHAAHLSFQGRLGLSGGAELDAVLDRAMAESRLEVFLDFAGVDYLSSPGLRVLERHASELEGKGGRLVVRSATDPVRLALELAGLERLVEPLAGSDA